MKWFSVAVGALGISFAIFISLLIDTGRMEFETFTAVVGLTGTILGGAGAGAYAETVRRDNLNKTGEPKDE